MSKVTSNVIVDALKSEKTPITLDRAGKYGRYLLLVLVLVLILNKVDGVALALLLQDIKLDLHLTDTQLGLLTGIAFTLFYSVMGVPIARAADRGNRIHIIAVATALQCGAVALTGAATNFVNLLLIRVGVAVGEAGCVPPANSLIAEHFERAERPRATAIYMLGYPLSSVVGYCLAGYLNEIVGWRLTFVILGLPGLALAVLVSMTLREPRRSARRSHQSTQPRQDESPQPPLLHVLTFLWRSRAYRHVLIGYSLVGLFGIGLWVWAPVLFVRNYGISTGELGLWFALVWGGGGFVGTYLGGEFASRCARQNERLQLISIAAIYLIFGPLAASIYLAPNHHIAFGLLALAGIAHYAVSGPLFATVQSLVPKEMRAMAVATLNLSTNLIGMGLGPVIAGAMSDALVPHFSGFSLRYALLLLSPGFFWASWHLWKASVTVADEIVIDAHDRTASRMNVGL